MMRSNYIALLKYVHCLGILFFQIIKIDSCNIFVWCMLWFFMYLLCNQTTTACHSCANAHLWVTALFSMQE